MADSILMGGIRLFEKKENQPDFVLATGVITPNELVKFLKENPQLLTEYNGEKQVRIQILKSKAGKPYVSVDTWKPSETTGQGNTAKVDPEEEFPF
jgi:hypothetical protein